MERHAVIPRSQRHTYIHEQKTSLNESHQKAIQRTLGQPLAEYTTNPDRTVCFALSWRRRLQYWYVHHGMEDIDD
tara:strand:- start:192 stop:416 length:225 start_codon:yes stop_codon:yes gene_type:complete